MRAAHALIEPTPDDDDRTKGGTLAQLSPHWIPVEIVEAFRSFCNAQGRPQRDVIVQALGEFLTRAVARADD